MKKLIPLFILVAAALIIYFTKLHTYLSFSNLQLHQETLRNYVEAHFFWMSLAFIAVYILIISFSIPIAAYVSVFGGFLFPQPLSTLYVVIAATCGATLIFSACKTAIGSSLFDKARPYLSKMEKGFSNGAVSYLLFLRLTPIFPFWLVNIAPAFFNVPLRTYIWTTFVGIIPGAFVFTQAGRALASIITSGQSFSIQSILTTDIKIALFAIGFFSLLPFFIKKLYNSLKN